MVKENTCKKENCFGDLESVVSSDVNWSGTVCGDPSPPWLTVYQCKSCEQLHYAIGDNDNMCIKLYSGSRTLNEIKEKVPQLYTYDAKNFLLGNVCFV